MGGRISCSSELGKGSTFRIQVPLLPGRKPPDMEGQTPENGKGGRLMRVLVVEDNQANAMVCRKFLQRMGHKPLLAPDGPTALKTLEANPVDLVLMDVELPGMDGLEVTRRLRSREAGQGRPRMPVIVLTIHALQRFGGDKELLEQYFSLFLQEARQRLQHLREALQEGEVQSQIIESHALKGLAGTAGAECCRMAAARLEDAAREGKRELQVQFLECLESDFSDLQQILSRSTKSL